MDRLRYYWKRFLGRCCWAMLKAADFDNIANELLEACATYADPAAVIPKKLAELGGADQRLRLQIDVLAKRVATLEGFHDTLRGLPADPWYVISSGDEGPDE